ISKPTQDQKAKNRPIAKRPAATSLPSGVLKASEPWNAATGLIEATLTTAPLPAWLKTPASKITRMMTSAISAAPSTIAESFTSKNERTAIPATMAKAKYGQGMLTPNQVWKSALAK